MPAPELSVQLEIGDPSEDVLEYARLHCGEDPDTRLRAICELRDMIYERGECSPHRMDDAFLLRFLRTRMFVPARAHRLLVNYYKFREENRDLCIGVYPMDLRFIGDCNVLTVPPYRDQNGRRLLIYRIGCWDPAAFSVDEIFKATLVSLELGVLEPRQQVMGGVAIFDLSGIKTQHAWQVTPAVASRIVKLMVSSFPVITHAVHVINHSWVFDKIYALFKPLLNKRMRQFIYFHGHDNKSLHKHISPEHLPERYGGVMPDYSYAIWLESLRRNVTVVKEMLSAGFKVREEELDQDIREQLHDDGDKGRQVS